MCEYCEGDKPIHENLKHQVIGMIRFIRVKKRKWGPCLSISTATIYNGTKQNYLNINFCPMCGRNLKEADDGNDQVLGLRQAVEGNVCDKGSW